MAPAGVLANVARSLWPTGRVMLKTVGCAEPSNPSLTIGLPISTVRASDVATGGVVVVVVAAVGTVLAVGAGDCGVGLTGSVGLVAVGVTAFGFWLVVIDRLNKKIGITRNNSAAAAEPNARPQDEFKIPRSGFCCC